MNTKLIFWFVGPVIVVVVAWAFLSAGKNKAQTRGEEVQSWFTKSHNTMRSVGSSFH